MEPLPSLPAPGPLRVLALAASVAFLALFSAVGVHLVRRRWVELAWAGAAFIAFGLTAMGASAGPLFHIAAAATALGLALRNAYAFRGPARLASFLGAVGCAVAIVAGRMLFV